MGHTSKKVFEFYVLSQSGSSTSLFPALLYFSKRIVNFQSYFIYFESSYNYFSLSGKVFLRTQRGY